MLSWKLKQGETETAAKLSALLKREIDAERYSREGRSGILPLTKYVEELPEQASPEKLSGPATYNGKPLNILIMANSQKRWKVDISVLI